LLLTSLMLLVVGCHGSGSIGRGICPTSIVAQPRHRGQHCGATHSRWAVLFAASGTCAAQGITVLGRCVVEKVCGSACVRKFFFGGGGGSLQRARQTHRGRDVDIASRQAGRVRHEVMRAGQEAPHSLPSTTATAAPQRHGASAGLRCTGMTTGSRWRRRCAHLPSLLGCWRRPRQCPVCYRGRPDGQPRFPGGPAALECGQWRWNARASPRRYHLLQTGGATDVS